MIYLICLLCGVVNSLLASKDVDNEICLDGNNKAVANLQRNES